MQGNRSPRPAGWSAASAAQLTSSDRAKVATPAARADITSWSVAVRSMHSTAAAAAIACFSMPRQLPVQLHSRQHRTGTNRQRYACGELVLTPPASAQPVHARFALTCGASATITESGHSLGTPFAAVIRAFDSAVGGAAGMRVFAEAAITRAINISWQADAAHLPIHNSQQ